MTLHVGEGWKVDIALPHWRCRGRVHFDRAAHHVCYDK